MDTILVGNVGDMSATCRRHTTLSADFGDMACLCRHVADRLPRVLWVESVPPCRRAKNTRPQTQHAKPWPPSCTSALCTIVKWMPLCFQRLDCTVDSRHPKLHLSAKIDSTRPILIELWPSEFWLRNAPSQHRPSPSHISVNICPLPSIFSLKCSLCCP